MKYFLIFIISATLFYSCSEITDAPNEDGSDKSDKHHSKEIAALIKNEFSSWNDSLILNIAGEALITSPLVHEYYNGNNYHPAWSKGLNSNDSYKELLKLLSHSQHYGLDSNYYYLNSIRLLLDSAGHSKDEKIKHMLLAESDLLTTNTYFLFATHLRHGVLNPDSLTHEWKKDKLTVDLPKHLGKALKKQKLEQHLLALQPKHRKYVLLQQALVDYLKRHELNTDTITIPNFREDSITCYTRTKEVLTSLQYMDKDTSKSDISFIYALKKFQSQHGLTADGLVGKNTADALSVNSFERYKQLAVNLERWRWEDNWESDYLLISTPTYKLKVVGNDSVVMTFKIVIGNPKAQTPLEISSSLEYLITYPYWHVPHGIVYVFKPNATNC